MYIENVSGSYSLFLYGSDIISNTASNGMGGGAYFDNVTIEVDTTHFHNNSALSGGGIAITNNSNIDVVQYAGFVTAKFCDTLTMPANTYCSEFRNNEATSGTGGAIHVEGDSILDMERAAFISNHAGIGAAIYSASSNDVIMSDNGLFHDNVATGFGLTTLYMASNGVLTLNNNTFADNNGRPIWVFGGSALVTLNNNLIWGNGAAMASTASIGGSCNIDENGVSGAIVDPKFATTGRGDYRLGVNSGAIDECTAGTSEDMDFSQSPNRWQWGG